MSKRDDSAQTTTSLLRVMSGRHIPPLQASKKGARAGRFREGTRNDWAGELLTYPLPRQQRPCRFAEWHCTDLHPRTTVKANLHDVTVTRTPNGQGNRGLEPVAGIASLCSHLNYAISIQPFNTLTITSTRTCLIGNPFGPFFTLGHDASDRGGPCPSCLTKFSTCRHLCLSADTDQDAGEPRRFNAMELASAAKSTRRRNTEFQKKSTTRRGCICSSLL
jgi:hypothetical protein